MKFLQIYTSREGQTAKIMQHMADEWMALGHQVDTRHLTEQTGEMVDLAEFDWIILGGSIHYGKHEAFLGHFIQKHRVQLDKAQTLFISVNLTARKAEKNRPETNPYLKKFLQRIQWQPTRAHVFAGALLYSRYRFWDKQIIRFIMWITKGNTDTRKDIDYTNWEEVKQLAKELVS